MADAPLRRTNARPIDPLCRLCACNGELRAEPRTPEPKPNPAGSRTENAGAQTTNAGTVPGAVLDGASVPELDMASSGGPVPAGQALALREPAIPERLPPSG